MIFSDDPWSPRRINRLGAQLRSRSYLEIGVEEGKTFFAVSSPLKVGVDPHFQFEALPDRPGVELHQTTSDDFFAHLEPDTTFDLMFIDGLHTFEQTYRDLCNALLHSHLGTAILIDDTWPIDYFSSLPDQALALSLRAASGATDRSWHGDVFKLVFAIHDFHPGLAYRTIFGSGNPQTLVWRSRSFPRAPAVESLEGISRLTYADLLENVAVMRSASEDEAITECLGELQDRPSRRRARDLLRRTGPRKER